MKLSKFAAAAVLIAAVILCVVYLAPDAAHAGGLFAANAALLALRSEHTDIVAKAAAKIAEVKPGLTAEATAKIETDHQALLAQAKTIDDRIKAIETEPAPAAGKAWACSFYASAEASGVALKDLNEIVMKSATHDAAKDALIDAMAKGNANLPGPNGGHITLGTEDTEKFVTGVTRALVAKASMFKKEDGERNEFSSLSLRELARMSLDRRGVREMPHDPMMMIQAAMNPVIMQGAMSTSDFANILANVANKSLLKGYEEAPENFDKWTAKGQLSDFKTAKRVDLGLFPSLAQVDEGSEYSYGTLSDRGVSLVLATYGKLFPITRQSIINDDLGAFTKIPLRMGQAAKRTIANLVYAVLTANPTMADSVALFHATHTNLLTGGTSVLSADSLDLGRATMAKQKDPDNIKQGLNIRPRYWIGPVGLQGKANQLFASQAEPGQENPAVANRVANMAEVITDARLDVASATAWYLSGDPSSYDTIEVDYLNGNEAPVLEQREGWNIDGVEFKVRMDAGVNLLDFRALLKSNGA